RRKRREVAFHRIHAVDHDQPPAIFRREPQLLFEIGGVVVAELDLLGETEPRAVDDARMVEAVEEHGVVASEQRRQNAEVYLETGREDQRGLALHEMREAL